jgi:hypothetical protein
MRPIADRTFDFAVRIVKLCAHLKETPGASRTLANQLLRSGNRPLSGVEGDFFGRSGFLLLGDAVRTTPLSQRNVWDGYCGQARALVPTRLRQSLGNPAGIF